MEKNAKRMYLVTEYDHAEKKFREYLVNALNQAQAVRHAAKGRFEAEVCTVTDAVRLGAGGVKVQDAGEE